MKNSVQFSFVPTLDTTAYAAGDTLFTTVLVPDGTEFSGQRAIVHSMTVIDRESVSAAMTLHLFSQAPTTPVINSPFALSDGDAAFYQCSLDFNPSDYYPATNNSIGQVSYLGRMFRSFAPNDSTVYIVGVVNSVASFATVNPLTIRLGLLWL